MATNTAGTAAREYHTSQIHYLRKDITYADGGTTAIVGIMPAGALVLPQLCGIAVTTAFNGDTTNTSDIGITGALTKYASALALGTLGFIETDVITAATANSSLTTADEEILATIISTASASTGAAVIVMAYLAPGN